jgi:hypothetical protein
MIPASSVLQRGCCCDSPFFYHADSVPMRVSERTIFKESSMKNVRIVASTLAAAALVGLMGVARAETAGGAQSATYNGMQHPGTGTGPGQGVGNGPNTGGGGSQGHGDRTGKGFYDSSQYEQPNLSAYKADEYFARERSLKPAAEISSSNRALDNTQGR